jgi:hypothetical protein
VKVGKLVNLLDLIITEDQLKVELQNNDHLFQKVFEKKGKNNATMKEGICAFFILFRFKKLTTLLNNFMRNSFYFQIDKTLKCKKYYC